MLKKVQSGDPLVIPATTFNTFVDVARDFQQRQRNARTKSEREFRQAGIILVRNDSGEDRKRFDVLGISAPIISPADNADGFLERVAIRGVTPTDTHVGRFVILLEPVANGAIGRACIDGVCPARVQMIDEGMGLADVKPDYCDTLRSVPDGSAQLLWVQPVEERETPDVALVVARLGVAQPTQLFLEVTSLTPDPVTKAWTAAAKGMGVRSNTTYPISETEYRVFNLVGGELFCGCRGLCLPAAVVDGVSYFAMVSGEVFGFAARTTSGPYIGEGNLHWYSWEQTGWTPAHTNESGGANPLGRALLVSSLAHDAAITERHGLPYHTPIFLRYDLANTRFWFDGSVEPLTQDCG